MQQLNNSFADLVIEGADNGITTVHMTVQRTGLIKEIRFSCEVELEVLWFGVERVFPDGDMALRSDGGSKGKNLTGKVFSLLESRTILNTGQSVSAYVKTPSVPLEDLQGEVWAEVPPLEYTQERLRAKLSEGPLTNQLAVKREEIRLTKLITPVRIQVQRSGTVEGITFSREVVVHRVFLGLTEYWPDGEVFREKGDRTDLQPWQGREALLESKEYLLGPGQIVVAMVSDPEGKGNPLTMEIWGRLLVY